jgi:exodeoxyribonuclease VII large subunit
MELSRKAPRIEARTTRVILLWQRLVANFDRQQAARNSSVDRIADALGHLNPEAILARGFAVVRDENGDVVFDPGKLNIGQAINLRLAAGEVDATVVATRPV